MSADNVTAILDGLVAEHGGRECFSVLQLAVAHRIAEVLAGGRDTAVTNLSPLLEMLPSKRVEPPLNLGRLSDHELSVFAALVDKVNGKDTGTSIDLSDIVLPVRVGHGRGGPLAAAGCICALCMPDDTAVRLAVENSLLREQLRLRNGVATDAPIGSVPAIVAAPPEASAPVGEASNVTPLLSAGERIELAKTC